MTTRTLEDRKLKKNQSASTNNITRYAFLSTIEKAQLHMYCKLTYKMYQ